MFKKGFTVIEIALVLAIAGLIFLMVFITLPSLRVAQKDSTRRDDVSRLVTAISNYASNNRGSISNITDSKLAPYLGDNFSDPDGDKYTIEIKQLKSDDENNTIFPPDFIDYKMYIGISASCEGESIKYNPNNRNYAVLYRLEGSGAYCMDNQL